MGPLERPRGAGRCRGRDAAVLTGHVTGLDLLAGGVGGYAGHAVNSRIGSPGGRLSARSNARLARFRALLADETGAIGPGVGDLKAARATATGLRSPESMKAMAQQVKALEHRWGGLTPPERVSAIQAVANTRLSAVGVPPLRGVEVSPHARPGFNSAGFDVKTWRLQTDAQVIVLDSEFRWLAEAAYHEGRHAEQFFQMARLKAGEGMSLDALARSEEEGGFGMPRDVLELAAARPLAADSVEGRQAAQWYDSLYGVNKPARARVYEELNASREEVEYWLFLRELSRKEGDVEGVADADAYLPELIKDYQDKEVGYHTLPEEIDSHAVAQGLSRYLDEIGVKGVGLEPPSLDGALLSAESVSAAAGAARALELRWATLSDDDRFTELEQVVNSQLAAGGIPPVTVRSIVDGSRFKSRAWRIAPQDETGEDLADFRRALGVTYHEARHAEQIFQIARLKAGEGMGAESIAHSLRIPRDVADLAAARPLDPASPDGRQALRWSESFGGKGGAEDAALFAEYDAARAAQMRGYVRLGEAQTSGDPEAIRIATEQVAAERARAQRAYLALPHEADANAAMHALADALGWPHTDIRPSLPADIGG